MARPLLVDNPLLIFGELYAKPSHDPPPCGATGEASLPIPILVYHNPADAGMSH